MLFVVDGVKLGKLTKIQQLSECSFEEFSPNCERNFEHQRNPQQRIKIENSTILQDSYLLLLEDCYSIVEYLILFNKLPRVNYLPAIPNRIY